MPRVLCSRTLYMAIHYPLRKGMPPGLVKAYTLSYV